MIALFLYNALLPAKVKFEATACPASEHDYTGFRTVAFLNDYALGCAGCGVRDDLEMDVQSGFWGDQRSADESRSY